MALFIISFFLHDTATSDIYTLSLHDALPIFDPNFGRRVRNRRQLNSLQNTWPYGYSMPIAVRYTQDAFSRTAMGILDRKSGSAGMPRPISYAVFCLKKKTEEAQKLVMVSSMT